MVLTYLGGSSVRIQFGDTTIAYNPVAKESKDFTSTRYGADICLISTNHPDMNGSDQVTFGEKQPFIVMGPGEYERGGIFIRGLESKSVYGGGDRINTIYTLGVDSINLCFLGTLSTKELPSETSEQLEEIDILFVPVGEGVLSAKDAYALAVSLEPKMIIPLSVGNKAAEGKALEVFLKESGEKSAQPVEKVTLKRKDLEGKEGDIVILHASK